jgi:hypothetical protein
MAVTNVPSLTHIITVVFGYNSLNSNGCNHCTSGMTHTITVMFGYNSLNSNNRNHCSLTHIITAAVGGPRMAHHQ